MPEIPDAQVGTLELYRMLSRVEELVKDLDNKLDRNAISIAEHELRIKSLEEGQREQSRGRSTLRLSLLAAIPASVIAVVFGVLTLVVPQ